MRYALVLDYYMGQAEAAARVVAAWPGRGNDAAAAEHVLQAFLPVAQAVVRLPGQILGDLEAQQASELQPTETSLRTTLSLCQQTLRGLLPLANGISDQLRATAQQALAELTKCEAEMAEWPEFEPQHEAEAQREFEEADLLELEAAFAQIAGVDVDTWRTRVAAHAASTRKSS